MIWCCIFESDNHRTILKQHCERFLNDNQETPSCQNVAPETVLETRISLKKSLQRFIDVLMTS